MEIDKLLIKDLPIDDQAFYCSWHGFSMDDTVEFADSELNKIYKKQQKKKENK